MRKHKGRFLPLTEKPLAFFIVAERFWIKSPAPLLVALLEIGLAETVLFRKRTINESA